MIDFLMISTRSTKSGVIEIYPKFIIKKSSDLMIRGGDFYAIWLEDRGLWSSVEQDAIHLIDRELDRYAEENKQRYNANIRVLHMWDAETGMIDVWHKYCQRQMRDSFVMLDERLIFANTPTNKKDYATKRLSYPLEHCDIPAFDKLISTLYSTEERHKIEWAIGSIVAGESKNIQKFMVLYGSGGTGKSTILNIIQKLFHGYFAVFDAKALGSSNNSFALEAFKQNPLVAIQHDGDLSRIEDNTRLNSLVSHELMTVNEKFKSTYASSFKCFLFMGTNKPVKITDAKSGLIRRLIDVSPTGNKLHITEYNRLYGQIDFELGGIATHCLEVFTNNPDKYDNYTPINMLGASNDFYNYILDSYYIFTKEEGTTLKSAWELYKTYCDDAKVTYPLSQRAFKEELKNYFYEYEERHRFDDDTRVRSYYVGFRKDKFEDISTAIPVIEKPKMIEFNSTESIFDSFGSDCSAQYATSAGIPSQKWDKVTTKLKDLDTSKIHYVRVPENHIIIDFDIPDENGNKSLVKNLEAASVWPPTYAELSKSGEGIHLHYNYNGDASKLSVVYDDHVEIKLAVGNSALRRKLSKCNNLPIATISSGLPLKGEDKMVNFESVKSEKGIRTLIKRNLNKEIHPGTKPSIDFIHKILEDSYTSGLCYDVSDMRNVVLAFAMSSTNQSDYCVKLVGKMKFKSEEISESSNNTDDKLIFYDCEVFPNLFIVNWKLQGEGKPVVRMINPKPSDIETLMQRKLVGFNCRRYDNHILYARMMGYSNEQLYGLSQKIINGEPGCFFGEAYNVSYTDVYDFASSVNKQSLKKWEIQLGIHHQELGLPWDQPVPEEMWTKVAEYCDNDVLATEAVFSHLQSDWTARQILADVAGMTVNDTTNTLTTRIVFGNNRKPQSEFPLHRNLADPIRFLDVGVHKFLVDHNVLPMDFDDYSVLPYFPGYEFKNGISTYRDEDIGKGGYVYAEPGMYGNVALLDVASMHPTSIITEVLFGEKYTTRFKELKDARVHIKHKDYESAKLLLDGKLTPYLESGKYSASDLAVALKTAINSVYGLTFASFDNPFRDKDNIDNVVAKRGALFMVDLKHAIQEQGFIVAHIKTDSIKIPDATPEIIQFVMDYGKKYGYDFEHEATYDRICLVNHAVYIAKYAEPDICQELYGYVPRDNKDEGGNWTATGTQFQVPYVLKKLFTKEEIIFNDMCETKSVTSALYLDMNEGDEESHNYHFVGKDGRFCPMKPGCGGGLLLRETTNKQTGEKGFAAATGSKGYRWMESEMVKQLGKEDCIDRSYYDKLVDDAAMSISVWGSIDWFTSDDPYTSPSFKDGKPVYDEEIPFC